MSSGLVSPSPPLQDWSEAEREASEELRSAPGAPQALGLSGSELLPSEGAAPAQTRNSSGEGQFQGKGKEQPGADAGTPGSSLAAPTSPPTASSPPADAASGLQRGAAQGVQWSGSSSASADGATPDGTPEGAAPGMQGAPGEEGNGSGTPQAGQGGADPVVRAYQERGVGVAQEEAPPTRALQRSSPSGAGAGTPGVRRTVWGQADLAQRFGPLREDARADVVVVGAGINGLSLAHELQSSGMDVVVLEARVVGACAVGYHSRLSCNPLE